MNTFGERMGGVYTALITPWTDRGELDEAALAELIRHQARGGVAGIVLAGTTGEAPMLEIGEYRRLIAAAAEASAAAGGRLRILAGVGGNDTHKCRVLAAAAREAGADALLAGTPYYVKPTQHGLLAHFRAVADAGERPVVLYNIPGRTGVAMEVETTLALAEDERFAGLKEASGDLEAVQEILYHRPRRFAVLAGDDALILPVIALGGDGVISVLSNEVPAACVELVAAALGGERRRACDLQRRLWPLMRANFVESNPIPVKWALSRMGLAGEAVREPLTPLSPELRPRVEEALRQAGALAAVIEAAS